MQELFDEYCCIADYCDHDLIDGVPPCFDCDFCVPVFDLEDN